MNILLKLSTAPWLCGWYFPPNICLILLLSSHFFVKSSLTNSFPLCVKDLRLSNHKGLSHVIPNCFCFFVWDCICKPIFTKVIYNCQEVRIVMIISFLLSSYTVSAWYLSNYEFDIIYITILFLFLILLNIWHDSKSLQKRSHSSYIFDQYTFSLFDKYSSITLVLRCDFVDICAQSRR